MTTPANTPAPSDTPRSKLDQLNHRLLIALGLSEETATADPACHKGCQSLVHQQRNAALVEQNAQQLAACDCAAMLDTTETHEGNKTVVQGNPFWSPAYDSVMRRTAECIKLRAENTALVAENAGLREALSALVPEVEKLRDSSRVYLQLGGEFGYSAAHTDTSETVRLNALLDAARTARPKSHPEGDA